MFTALGATGLAERAGTFPENWILVHAQSPATTTTARPVLRAHPRAFPPNGYNTPMLRRWLIRVPCLLALTFVVGVWITSYFGGFGCSEFVKGRGWYLTAVQGLGCAEECGGLPGNTTLFQSYFDSGATAQELLPEPTTLGFYASRMQRFPDSFVIIYPLWLPTLLLTGLNWLVLRKTRPKRLWQGFPMEFAPKEATNP